MKLSSNSLGNEDSNSPRVHEEMRQTCINGSATSRVPVNQTPTSFTQYPGASNHKPLPSDLKIKKCDGEIYSKDVRLNTDPELLESFFYSNSTRPNMRVKIKGFRYETYKVPFSSLNHAGFSTIREEERTRLISCFKLSFDIITHITEKGFVQFAPSKTRTDTESIMTF